ncbi:MAG: type II toxin-antitoxin system HicB family antitoxin [Leptospiraceae bacterium]|nr:type II toxin-antitoxin system HicB family antitoxin [Leptospiraceae bacterium]
MEYHFKVHKEKKGYWAECIELSGCITQADTKEQLIKNCAEALNVFLNESTDSKHIFHLPKKNVQDKELLKVAVDPKIAFAQLLRMARHKRGLSQKQATTMIGLKNIYSYQRLESSKGANPALITISKIKRVFPEFPLDLVV